jgi:hypothetical protein
VQDPDRVLKFSSDQHIQGMNKYLVKLKHK